MSQFRPENNVLVGTIPDIQPITLPEGNPFTTRIMQFEKMRISASEDLYVTIDFWIALTEAANVVFKTIEITVPTLNESDPYLQDKELIMYVPQVLRLLLLQLEDKAATESVSKVIATLQTLPDEILLDHAKSLLGYLENEVDKEFQIFLLMALKIIYVKNATLVELPKLEVEKAFLNCPMCGDAPIASVIDPMNNGLRYLVCNLCETKWHKVRSTCHSCTNTGSIELLSLEEQESIMKAESCPECQTYIKHIDRTKNPMLDVFVEDLATLSLDFTLAEEGQQRKSFNLYLR